MNVDANQTFSQTERERLDRAFGYPYPVPETADFVFADGEVAVLESDFDLSDRVPVLAVGSNRSPVQLLRKFGRTGVIPVTEFSIPDHDVAYCAYLTHYGSLPVTLVDAPGTSASLSITWLTRTQLVRMHETESVGPNTHFGKIDVGEFCCNGRAERQVFTYVSARGLLRRQGGRVLLAGITATGRPEGPDAQGHQHELLTHVWRSFGAGGLEHWVLSIIADRARRDALNEVMQNTVNSAVPARFEPVDNIATL